jgi:hypothetical protein
VPLPDLTLWMLTTLVEAFVVCLFLIQGQFRKFLFLNFYLLLSVAINIGRYAVLSHFGYVFSEYASFYYFSDVLVTVTLFLSICELSVRLVGTKMPRRRVVLLSAGALLVAAWSSFSFASSSDFRVTTRFVFQLSQNILFVCGLAIVVLWAWKLRNDPDDRIAARFVSVLGVYFSLFFLAYRAGQLAPYASGLHSLLPMIGAWLPLGCGFALVSQEQPRRRK